MKIRDILRHKGLYRPAGRAYGPKPVQGSLSPGGVLGCRGNTRFA